MSHIVELSFTSAWDAMVEHWRFTIHVQLSDSLQDSKRETMEFWSNAVHITDHRVSFGWGSIHVTTKDNTVYLVKPVCFGKTVFLPFAPEKTYAAVMNTFLCAAFLADPTRPALFRFPQDHLTRPFVIGFGSDCTCSEDKCNKACVECGVLACGCIDICRGRCGSHRSRRFFLR